MKTFDLTIPKWVDLEKEDDAIADPYCDEWESIIHQIEKYGAGRTVKIVVTVKKQEKQERETA